MTAVTGQVLAGALALPASIPSPSQGVWHLGPFPLRAYALAILLGIVVAVVLTQRRWVERGGVADDVLEIVFWAVPFGIVGGRIYHVISSPDAYFGVGGNPWKAFAIWEGGLGIWGAIALGGVGAWIGCRRQGVRMPAFADAVAPGLLVAQAIGRLGNWFNQELFGGPTTLPWGLQIDDAHLPTGYASGTLFHPTFLYELLWNLAAAGVLIWLDRRFKLGHGRVFALYVVLYTSGRLWIELMRIDPAHTIGPFRLNVWTSIVVGLGALVAFVLVSRRHPDRETTLLRDPPAAQGDEESAPEASR
jgi:prolipoprotein diacylglyceryl transferase